MNWDLSKTEPGKVVVFGFITGAAVTAVLIAIAVMVAPMVLRVLK